VLDDTEMAALGMGALLGVAQGSARPARLLAIEWKGDAGTSQPMRFVGKGVTFDTGGISIKPAAGMEDMKWDMGGAGAVVPGLLALARRKAKANVVASAGWSRTCPTAMRSARATSSPRCRARPSRCSTPMPRAAWCCATCSGTQQRIQARAVIDLATLTGAIIVALGTNTPACSPTTTRWPSSSTAAGKSVGEQAVALAAGRDYDKHDRQPDRRHEEHRQSLWRLDHRGAVHPALHQQGHALGASRHRRHGLGRQARPTWDKGATGFGVRLLDRFVRDSAGGLTAPSAR
jgi:leucyl aminopeptidase